MTDVLSILVMRCMYPECRQDYIVSRVKPAWQAQ